jgi:hypothetical protein
VAHWCRCHVLIHAPLLTATVHAISAARVHAAAVTETAKQGHTETQASAAVQAIIDDFRPQWKALLRQR